MSFKVPRCPSWINCLKSKPDAEIYLDAQSGDNCYSYLLNVWRAFDVQTPLLEVMKIPDKALSWHSFLELVNVELAKKNVVITPLQQHKSSDTHVLLRLEHLTESLERKKNGYTYIFPDQEDLKQKSKHQKVIDYIANEMDISQSQEIFELLRIRLEGKSAE